MAKTINCRGTLLDTGTPLVMGIINLTEDSFYAGSRVNSETKLLQTAETMLTEGASILDVGAMSSRPGARLPEEMTELEKISWGVQSLGSHFPQAIVSVDTMRSRVARVGLDAGAAIINDISGGEFDPQMMSTVAAYGAPYILMHMKGLPENMQQNATYDDVVLEVMSYFSRKIHDARSAGINDIILDPGFGFGKTIKHNFEILRQFEVFGIWGLPVLAGISRKSMIWKTLSTDPAGALNGTTALHMVALQKGAGILRVHDVREAMECIRLHGMLTG